MAKTTKTVKRVTHIYTPHKVHINKEYRAIYISDESTYSEAGCLESQLDMSLTDWKRLGNPSKIRVTVTVIDE